MCIKHLFLHYFEFILHDLSASEKVQIYKSVTYRNKIKAYVSVKNTQNICIYIRQML